MKLSPALILFVCLSCINYNIKAQPAVLKTNAFANYISKFNADDEELFPQHITNAAAFDFLAKNIPLLDCPDEDLQRTYYFRWWAYRKHIRKTPEGFVILEFLPDVEWAGKNNTISCPAALHFYEGRWLHDQQYLDDYARFWFRGGGSPRAYSFWAADAIYSQYLQSGNPAVIKDLFKDLIDNYKKWEEEKLDPNGLFWQVDDRDGMEVSICGSGGNEKGYRATINSYMYADAIAISKIAGLLKETATEARYKNKAALIKQKVQQSLWDSKDQFFKVIPRKEGAGLCDARELHGYTPWLFSMPDKNYASAWKYLMDPKHFYAPFGPTSADQSHPGFKVAYTGHECQWNGPSWPLATSITLTGLANLLNQYDQPYINKEDYFSLLKVYTNSHQRKREDGKIVPWIDENLNPFTGDWISRTRLKTWADGTWASYKGGPERGKDYNHSTYCDLIISGLIGIRPQEGNQLTISPLLPAGKWDYFCLDNVKYHGRILTVMYDKTGERYRKGKGFRVLIDGKVVATRPDVSTVSLKMK